MLALKRARLISPKELSSLVQQAMEFSRANPNLDKLNSLEALLSNRQCRQALVIHCPYLTEKATELMISLLSMLEDQRWGQGDLTVIESNLASIAESIAEFNLDLQQKIRISNRLEEIIPGYFGRPMAEYPIPRGSIEAIKANRFSALGRITKALVANSSKIETASLEGLAPLALSAFLVGVDTRPIEESLKVMLNGSGVFKRGDEYEVYEASREYAYDPLNLPRDKEKLAGVFIKALEQGAFYHALLIRSYAQDRLGYRLYPLKRGDDALESEAKVHSFARAFLRVH